MSLCRVLRSGSPEPSTSETACPAGQPEGRSESDGKGTRFEWGEAAFGAVDHQFELVFGESDQACHHALGGCRAFHHHDKVVGISGKLMSACFEFFIEWIENSRGTGRCRDRLRQQPEGRGSREADESIWPEAATVARPVALPEAWPPGCRRAKPLRLAGICGSDPEPSDP